MRLPVELATWAASKVKLPTVRPEKLRFRSAATDEVLSVPPVERKSIAPVVALPWIPPVVDGAITAVALTVRFPGEGIAVLVPFLTPFQLVRLPLPNWCDAFTKFPLNVSR